MKKFDIVAANNYIWNLTDLNQYLVDNQGQDILLTTKTEGCCCRAIGLYQLLDQFKFNSVTIATANPLETHDRYVIKLQFPWKFLEVSTPIEPEYHCWDLTRVFGAIYGRPLWHRIGIWSHLATYHDDLSLLGCQASARDIDARQLFEVGELFKNSVTSFKNFSNLLDRFPAVLDEVDNYTPGQLWTDGYVAQTKRVYRHFLVDLVAETFTSGNCFFVTEKTVRPMLLKKPFVIMGSRNYLNYLRQMGFMTFGEFWNEDYDGYEGQERFVRILKLIDQLAAMSKDQLEQLYWNMQYSLEHNYNLLLDRTYKTNITCIP